MRKLGNRHKAYNEIESALGECSFKHKNGKKSPVSNVATFESRSRGGIVSGNKNKESGHWAKVQLKFSSENGKKNIKYTQTKEARTKAIESASYIIEQLSLDRTHIKFWNGIKSFDDSGFTYASIKKHIQNQTKYKGYLWRFEKISNKNHKKSEWTTKKIKEVALVCSYKAEFKSKYQQAYWKAKELGIFDSVTKHMKRPKAKNQYTKK